MMDRITSLGHKRGNLVKLACFYHRAKIARCSGVKARQINNASISDNANMWSICLFKCY
jgi:hypothetical protein